MLIKLFKINVLKEIFSNIEEIDIYFFQAIYKRLFNYYYQTYTFWCSLFEIVDHNFFETFLYRFISRLLRELTSKHSIFEVD
jgi:hypothetical protein